MKQNKPPNPLNIGFLRPSRKLLEPHHLPALIQKFQLGIWQESFLRAIRKWNRVSHKSKLNSLETGLTTVLKSNQVKRMVASLTGAGPAAPAAEHSKVLHAKCQSPPPELGQTGETLFLRILACYNHITQNRPIALPELGQTAVWPNTC
jgi:hypothetical protein